MRLIENYCDYLRYERRYSPHTLNSYQTDLEQWQAFMKENFQIEPLETVQELQKVTHAQMRQWALYLPYKRSSIKRKMTSVSAFLTYALKKEWIESDPSAKLPRMKQEKRLPSFVPQERMNEVFKPPPLPEKFTDEDRFIQVRDLLLLEILYGCGLRAAEIAALRLADIDQQGRMMRVLGKGKKERFVPFGDHVSQALSLYLKECVALSFDYKSGSLLLSHKGKPARYGLIYPIVKRWLSTIPELKKKSPHVLRHTYATHLLDAGCDINAVKELLGHSSLAATQVYTHNTLAKLKQQYAKAHPRAEIQPDKNAPNTAPSTEDASV